MLTGSDQKIHAVRKQVFLSVPMSTVFNHPQQNSVIEVMDKSYSYGFMPTKELEIL